MGFVVTSFSIVCVVVAWLKSRDRAGGSRSWRSRVNAMGWGLLLLPIAWIAMWLFGVNPATVGLLLLSGAVLVMAPVIAADLAAVLLILLGLYGLAAAFAVFKHGRAVAQSAKAVSVSVVPGPAFARGKEVFASAKAVVISGGPGNVTAVPHPPKITGLPKPVPLPGPPKSSFMHQMYAQKIAALHQMAVPWAGPGIRPSPWYAALTGAGPQGYVPVLLAAFVFLAFGLWLVPRTLLARGALVGRLTSRVQRLSETRTDAVDTAAAELRRVERDLHDGAQARLVALGMSLRAAERMFETSPGAALAPPCTGPCSPTGPTSRSWTCGCRRRSPTRGCRRRWPPGARCPGCRCWSCRSTSSSYTPASCSPTRRAGWGTCSRTVCSTTTSSSRPSGPSPGAARSWTPRWCRSCWSGGPGTSRSPGSRRAS